MERFQIANRTHNHAMTNTEIAWAEPVLWIKTKI